MDIFKIFSGPSAEKLEQRGDALAAPGKWGRAKLEYERALIKAEKAPDHDPERKARLQNKIAGAKEALAREHLETIDLLLEGDNFDDAGELAAIALEISTEPSLRVELEARRQRIEEGRSLQTRVEGPDLLYGLGGGDVGEGSDEEIFLSLCSTLPPEVEQAYLSYDEDFREGYIALNQGDFDAAVDRLSAAMDREPAPDSYIALELATARLHQGDADGAQRLLERFVSRCPGVLPAYSVLCEIYWEKKEFHRAHTLLDDAPEDLHSSVAMVLLRGQTLTQSGDLEAAKSHYLAFFEAHGWNDQVAKALAGVHEALKETETARALYAEMISRCTGCRARVEPEVKHRYAELAYLAGHTGSDVTELYLSLAREMPQHAAHYFDRLSRIYATQGNTDEAERFRVFSAQAGGEKAESKSP